MATSERLTGFDRDMLKHFRYHNKLVKLCRILASIHVSGELFDKIAPKKFHTYRDNAKIRWELEDQIRTLLRQNGDFPR